MSGCFQPTLTSFRDAQGGTLLRAPFSGLHPLGLALFGALHIPVVSYIPCLSSDYATFREKCTAHSPTILCSGQAKGMRRRNSAVWLPLRQGGSDANQEP